MSRLRLIKISLKPLPPLGSRKSRSARDQQVVVVGRLLLHVRDRTIDGLVGPLRVVIGPLQGETGPSASRRRTITCLGRTDVHGEFRNRDHVENGRAVYMSWSDHYMSRPDYYMSRRDKNARRGCRDRTVDCRCRRTIIRPVAPAHAQRIWERMESRRKPLRRFVTSWFNPLLNRRRFWSDPLHIEIGPLHRRDRTLHVLVGPLHVETGLLHVETR